MTRNATHGSLILRSRSVGAPIVIVQVLVGIFLCVNCIMIYTFFKKEAFCNNTRYILFAHTLFCDTLFLVASDTLLILSFCKATMPAWMCMIFYAVVDIANFATPLTLTAMCLECYVAICLPLRYAEIGSSRHATHCILIIHALSAVMPLTVLSMVVSINPVSFYVSHLLCSVESLVVIKWQQNLRSAMSQLFFLFMSITIAFTYVRIMAAARGASADDKKSSSKGLRTVCLHTFQLLLCLIMLWLPLIETAVHEINVNVYLVLRSFDYIVFILAPHCLSPLVYGLRDEKFFLVLKNYVFVGCCKIYSYAPNKIQSI